MCAHENPLTPLHGRSDGVVPGYVIYIIISVHCKVCGLNCMKYRGKCADCNSIATKRQRQEEKTYKVATSYHLSTNTIYCGGRTLYGQRLPLEQKFRS